MAIYQQLRGAISEMCHYQNSHQRFGASSAIKSITRQLCGSCSVLTSSTPPVSIAGSKSRISSATSYPVEACDTISWFRSRPISSFTTEVIGVRSATREPSRTPPFSIWPANTVPRSEMWKILFTRTVNMCSDPDRLTIIAACSATRK